MNNIPMLRKDIKTIYLRINKNRKNHFYKENITVDLSVKKSRINERRDNDNA